MDIDIQLILQAAANVSAKHTQQIDISWYVTTFRTEVYGLLKKIGLTTPDGKYNGVESIQDEIKSVMNSYLDIVATFPEEIKYSDAQIEHPRANTVQHTLDIYHGVQTDMNAWQSAQELARMVATNADSDKDRISYAVLMGIVLCVLNFLGDVDLAGLCANFLQ